MLKFILKLNAFVSKIQNAFLNISLTKLFLLIFNEFGINKNYVAEIAIFILANIIVKMLTKKTKG